MAGEAPKTSTATLKNQNMKNPLLLTSNKVTLSNKNYPIFLLSRAAITTTQSMTYCEVYSSPLTQTLSLLSRRGEGVAVTRLSPTGTRV
jgi:hypothetical protein